MRSTSHLLCARHGITHDTSIWTRQRGSSNILSRRLLPAQSSPMIATYRIVLRAGRSVGQHPHPHPLPHPHPNCLVLLVLVPVQAQVSAQPKRRVENSFSSYLNSPHLIPAGHNRVTKPSLSSCGDYQFEGEGGAGEVSEDEVLSSGQCVRWWNVALLLGWDVMGVGCYSVS